MLLVVCYIIHNIECTFCNIIATLFLIVGSAVLNAYYGAGTGFIHLDGVQCTNSQTDLLQCSNSNRIPNCVHAQDAGVNCTGKCITVSALI